MNVNQGIDIQQGPILKYFNKYIVSVTFRNFKNTFLFSPPFNSLHPL